MATRAVACLVALLVLPGCGVRYVLRSGYYELELLSSGVPATKVLEDHVLSAGQEQRLELIPSLKAYGARLGLRTENKYDNVAVGWPRTIWNLTACDPLSFSPRTWWFPIVGRISYLGYFTDPDADAMKAKMLDQGLDVYVRSAGAFSTLGWFRDPVLPGMLSWSEADLADTLFHESAHATLWIPGESAFNESFAEAVGTASMHNWMVDRYGRDSRQFTSVLRGERDSEAYIAILHELYAELDAVFANPALDPESKLHRKAELYASIPDRIAASQIEDRAHWAARAKKREWNNAVLIQFKTYDVAGEDFAAVLDRQRIVDSGPDGVRGTGDDVDTGKYSISGFISGIEAITRPNGRWVRDPVVALKAAVGR